MSVEQLSNPLHEKTKISERLKLARDAKHLTQAALAEVSGVSRSSIVHYENGSVIPGGPEIIKLAYALEVTPNRILSGTEGFFPARESEQLLLLDDLVVLTNRASMCLRELGLGITEQFSTLLMTMVKEKLSDDDYQEFINMMSKIESEVQGMAPSLHGMAEEAADNIIQASQDAEG